MERSDGETMETLEGETVMTREQVRTLVNNQHLVYICLTAAVLILKFIPFILLIIINVGNSIKVL